MCTWCGKRWWIRSRVDLSGHLDQWIPGRPVSVRGREVSGAQDVRAVVGTAAGEIDKPDAQPVQHCEQGQEVPVRSICSGSFAVDTETVIVGQAAG